MIKPWMGMTAVNRTKIESLLILLAVLGFNLLGEGLRDAFDPKDA